MVWNRFTYWIRVQNSLNLLSGIFLRKLSKWKFRKISLDLDS